MIYILELYQIASIHTMIDLARRTGTKPPAVARLENALITGRPSPSLATLSRYARALGKQLEVRFV